MTIHSPMLMAVAKKLKAVYAAFTFYITTCSYILSNDFVVCMQYIYFLLNIVCAYKSGDIPVTVIGLPHNPDNKSFGPRTHVMIRKFDILKLSFNHHACTLKHEHIHWYLCASK